MSDRADGWEDECTEHRSEKSMNFKAFDESSEKPEEETIDDKRKNTKCDQVERKCQNEKNRLDRNIDNTPEKSEDERCTNPLHTDAWDEIREDEKRHRTCEPFEKKHSISFKKLRFYYTTFISEASTLFG